MKNSFKKILSSNRSGFTLIEMLIVVAVIGMIAALVGTQVMKRYDEARFNTSKIKMRQVIAWLSDFRRNCGSYPTTDMGLQALIEKPAGLECRNYAPEGYAEGKKPPRDGFDTEYEYESDGTTFKITSFGSDKQPGGEGYARDVTSDDLDE